MTQTIVLNISFPLGNEKILIGMNIRCWPELSKSNLVWGMPVACMLKYVKKKQNNSKQTISYHCCCTPPPPPLSYFCHSIWYAYPNVNIRCWPELSEGNLVWGILIACMLKWVKKKNNNNNKKIIHADYLFSLFIVSAPPSPLPPTFLFSWGFSLEELL